MENPTNTTLQPEGLFIPIYLLNNKNLNIFDAVILSFIKDYSNDEEICFKSDKEIATTLNINPATIPNALNKLYKLGYIDITHENNVRLLTYSYDAPHRMAKSGYIYIMKDSTHTYLKIGYSKDPKYRESTLQGEKPTISLVTKFKGTMSQEQAVHRILAKYRVRGEWFNVDVDTAIAAIKRIIGI
jgi:DNA-binding transcriptional regulator YhcF (GntR family)